MKFIDLFAWLWWFHHALWKLWYECVFASEIDQQLRDLYKKNFDFEISWDITKIGVKDIPSHDILCAWFPCQPFSHAWKQDGLNCSKNWNLFFEIIKILEYHKPKYFILENVANLKHHDEKKTWTRIESELKKLWYDVKWEILSPDEYNIPHHRKRFFIVWSLEWLDNFIWPKKIEWKKLNITKILDKKPKNMIKLGKREQEVLEIWQEFLSNFPKDWKLPSFPIWSMEYWATYPFEETNPNLMTTEELWKYKWTYWKSLKWLSKEEQIKNLPSYVSFAKHKEEYPGWKKRFIRENRAFYKRYKKYIDSAIKKIQKYPASFQKFEWNCQWEDRNIYKYIIQFRASGIRVKRTDASPSLISSTSSQIPVIWWEKRYITKEEASRLQGMGELEMPDTTNAAFKALWNALNADLVGYIAKELIKE